MASKIPKITGISIIHLGPVFKLMVPSDGGDHAGEVDLAVEHNALSRLHLILIMIFGMIIILIMYIHRHVVHQVWFNLWEATRSHCKETFVCFCF